MVEKSGKARRFSGEFRAEAVRRLGETGNVSALCRELGISRQLLYWWRERVERDREKQLMATGERLRYENARLKKVLLEKTLEVDFFKTAFEKVEALNRSGNGSGATASGKRSGN